MKAKKLLIFCICLTLIFSFTSCKKKKGKSATPKQDPPKKVSVLNPLTGEDGFDSNAVGKRPIAISINNAYPARPQWGFDSPDVVIEGLAEGGVTRMLWLYADVNKIPKAGSIRSARIDFVELAENFDSIFVHWGCSDTAQAMMRRNNTDHIDGMHGVYFKRDFSRNVPSEHTGYSNNELIKKAISDKKFRTSAKDGLQPYFAFNDSDKSFADSATKVNFKFSHYASYQYSYDSESKTYGGQYGSKQLKSFEGKPFRVKNLIILYFPSYKIINKSGSIDMDLSAGNGYVFTNGTVSKIKWTKGNDKNAKLVLKDENGNQIKLNKGKSYIALIPQANSGLTSIS
ncbi:MAG: DUF3048 domain-containing protein [Clostridia bacterium]|nr:DUF3048 domain-containing protein [Clostridia bacterium]